VQEVLAVELDMEDANMDLLVPLVCEAPALADHGSCMDFEIVTVDTHVVVEVVEGLM
jgi:hypothetical protein